MITALIRQRRRLALATLAIALGVGYLAGALTLLDRVSQGLDNLAAAGAERADLIVEGEVAYESALEQTRRLVPATIAPSLAGLPGIESVSSRVEEVVLILDADREPVVAPGISEQPLGANWPDDDRMAPYSFVGEGRPPVADGEVVIDARSARLAGVSVGDLADIVGKTGPEQFEVVGVVRTDQGELPAGSSLALFSTAEARRVFATPDNDNRVAIRVEEGADVEAVQQQVRALLPPGSDVVDGVTGAQHRQESLTRSFTLIRVLIMGFAALALVVGMVTVANSLTLLYAERRRTLAGLRLIGAHRRQLLTAALVEAAGLAAVASLLGAPLGLLLGRVIEGAVGALGTSIPVGGSVVSLSALFWAVLIGSVATVFAAVVPAARACRVSPIEAVAETPSASPIRGVERVANAALAAVAGIALLVGVMMLGDVAAPTALTVAVGIALVLGALSLLPAALSYAVAAGIRLVPTRPPTLSRIGARDAVRNRSRTAATTGALLLATAVVAGLAVFLASFARSIDGDVGRLVRSDLVVDSGTFTKGGLPGDLLVELDELPETSAVSGWMVGRITAGATPLRVTGVDGEAIDAVLDPGWVQGSSTTIEPGGIALEETTARVLGVVVGDLVPVSFTSGGVEQLEVDGIYRTGSLLLGDAMIDRTTLQRQVPASVDIAALVSLSADSPADRGAVEDLAGSFGVTSVLEPSEFIDARSELLTGFQRVIQWMLFFTLVQALVGVVNTLLLSVGERRREFGLLRATGASRQQILRLVLIEGMSFAAVGTALGLVVGVGGAVAAVRALNRFGISSVDLPLGTLALTATAAMLLGVVAAIVPARWAAAVPPLEAVADAGGDRSPLRRRRVAPASRRPVRTPSIPIPIPSGSSPENLRRRSLWVDPALDDAVVVTSTATAATAVAPTPRDPTPEHTTFEPAPAAVPEPALFEPMPEPAAFEPMPEPAAFEPVAGHAAFEPESVVLDPGRARPDLQPLRQDEIELPRPVFAPEPEFVVEPAAVVHPTAAVEPEAVAEPASATSESVSPNAESPAGEPPDPFRSGRSGEARRPAAAEGWVRPAPDVSSPEDAATPVFRAATPASPFASNGAGHAHRNGAAEPQVDPVVSIRLGPLLEQLAPATLRDAHRVLTPFARALAADEVVGHMVQGWTKGLLCLVAETDRRIIVLVDRFPMPLIESLDRESTWITLYGPPGQDHVSIAVVDGQRLLEVTGVRDRAQASELASAPTQVPAEPWDRVGASAAGTPDHF